MIKVSESWVLPFNIILVALIVLLFYFGYKKGFVRSLLSLVVTVVSFYVSYLLSDILAKYISLWPVNLGVLEHTVFESATRHFINRICWFVLLFIVIRIAFIFIDLFFKSIKQLPVLKEVDSILGGLLSSLESFIFILGLGFLLNTPLFQNGNILVENSIIKPINQVVSIVFSKVGNEMLDANAFTELLDNGKDLQNEYKNQLETWLIDNGYVEAVEELNN